jgi:hypothetical protein
MNNLLLGVYIKLLFEFIDLNELVWVKFPSYQWFVSWICLY